MSDIPKAREIIKDVMAQVGQSQKTQLAEGGKTMSDDLVKRARDALDGVTPGPWEFDDELDILAPDGDMSPWHVATATECCGHPFDQSPANARFIAASRDLVPAMDARIEQLVATNEALTAERDALAEKLEKAVARLTAMRDDREGYRHTAHFRRGAAVELAQITGGKTDDHTD